MAEERITATVQYVATEWSMDASGEEVHRYRPECDDEPTCLRLYVAEHIVSGDDG